VLGDPGLADPSRALRKGDVAIGREGSQACEDAWIAMSRYVPTLKMETNGVVERIRSLLARFSEDEGAVRRLAATDVSFDAGTRVCWQPAAVVKVSRVQCNQKTRRSTEAPACSLSATLLRAPQDFALPWLMSLNARQQFFFQPSPALPEPLNLRLETIEQHGNLAVLMTKRRGRSATGFRSPNDGGSLERRR
jgi:hypothetical protein